MATKKTKKTTGTKAKKRLSKNISNGQVHIKTMYYHYNQYFH